jgi:hypothetical protein
MDARLTRIKELIEQKQAIDTELEGLIAGAPVKARKPRTCKHCGQEGHTPRACPTKSSGEQSAARANEGA